MSGSWAGSGVGCGRRNNKLCRRHPRDGSVKLAGIEMTLVGRIVARVAKTQSCALRQPALAVVPESALCQSQASSADLLSKVCGS